MRRYYNVREFMLMDRFSGFVGINLGEVKMFDILLPNKNLLNGSEKEIKKVIDKLRSSVHYNTVEPYYFVYQINSKTHKRITGAKVYNYINKVELSKGWFCTIKKRNCLIKTTSTYEIFLDIDKIISSIKSNFHILKITRGETTLYTCLWNLYGIKFS